jgi:hypothetical protein
MSERNGYLLPIHFAGGMITSGSAALLWSWLRSSRDLVAFGWVCLVLGGVLLLLGGMEYGLYRAEQREQTRREQADETEQVAD